MAMSKTDFVGLADALRGKHLAPDVVDALAAFCKASNPAFMEERWRAYLAGDGGANGGRKFHPSNRRTPSSYPFGTNSLLRRP